jgi:hypothetical protein
MSLLGVNSGLLFLYFKKLSLSAPPPSIRVLVTLDLSEQERLDHVLKGSADQEVKQLGKRRNRRCDRQYSKEKENNPLDGAEI